MESAFHVLVKQNIKQKLQTLKDMKNIRDVICEEWMRKQRSSTIRSSVSEDVEALREKLEENPTVIQQLSLAVFQNNIKLI